MKLVTFTGILILLLTTLSSVRADTTAFEKLDYEACRVLVEQNEILSLQALSDKVSELKLGRMIDMVLLKSETRYIYEMEIARDDGMVKEFYIDARTGDLLSGLPELKKRIPDNPFWKFGDD